MADLTQELTSLKSGADTTLGTVETSLKDEINPENLPLVGDAIKSSFDGSPALHGRRLR